MNIAVNNNPALKITGGSSGNVNITLAAGSNNILQAGANGAGLQKNGASATGTLTIGVPDHCKRLGMTMALASGAVSTAAHPMSSSTAGR